MPNSHVTLTAHEIRVAALTGCERRIQSLGLPDNHGYDDTDGWTDDIEGAAGEMAFCKLKDRYWSFPVGTFKAADVGSKVQVRTVPHDGLSLIIRTDACPDHAYVLMVGRIPSFRCAGWIWARDGKHDHFRRAPNGRPEAWFVPETHLTPLAASAGRHADTVRT